MPTLSSTIVKRDVASSKDVERALARQALHGGDLVLNLLETVPLHEEPLLRAVAESVGLEPAPSGEIQPSPAILRETVPLDLVRRHPMYPLSVSDGQVVIAVADRLPPEVEGELAAALGLPVLQKVALLVRLRQALARDYGAPIDQRTERALSRLDGRPDPNPSAPPAPAARRPTVPPESGAGSGPRRTARPAIDLAAFARSGPPSSRRRRLGPYTAAMAEEDLLEAKERDEILSVFFDFASQYFEYSALFAVHGELAEGRDAHGSGASREKIRTIGVPLDLPSTFALVVSGNEPFRLARLSASGIDATLAHDLERRPGPLSLVLPVRVRHRAVLVLYGDHGERDVELDAVGDVIAFTPLVVAALERVILRRKGIAPRRSLPAPRAPRDSMPAARTVSVAAPPTNSPTQPSPELRPVLSVGPGPRVHTPAPTTLAPPSPSSEPPSVSSERPQSSVSELPPSSSFRPPSVSLPTFSDATGAFENWPDANDEGDGEAALRALALEVRVSQPESIPPAGSLPLPSLADAARNVEVRFSQLSTSPPAGGLPLTALADATRNVEALVQELVAGEPDVADRLVALGEAAVPALASTLPGPITSELRRGSIDGPPRASDCGPVLRALARIGPVAASAVAVRTNDSDSVVRAWATRLLGELPSPIAAEAVSRRFFDEAPDVRRAALAAGRMLATAGETGRALAGLLSDTVLDAKQSDRVRQMAVEAISDLREVRAIPSLVGALGAGSAEIRRSVHWALVVLTRADFGMDAEPWNAWWNEHGSRHRIEWLIDALVHDDQEIRKAAGDELKSLTREYFGYYDDLSPRERERAQSRYREWWETRGRSRFTGA